MNLIDTTDKSRQMAATFIALADANAAHIWTSEFLTENFMLAFQYATHMVKGGSYSGRESQMVFTQLKKLERHFA